MTHLKFKKQIHTSLWYRPKKGIRAGNSPIWTEPGIFKKTVAAGKTEEEAYDEELRKRADMDKKEWNQTSDLDRELLPLFREGEKENIKEIKQVKNQFKMRGWDVPKGYRPYPY